MQDSCVLDPLAPPTPGTALTEGLGVSKTKGKNDKTVLWHLATAPPIAVDCVACDLSHGPACPEAVELPVQPARLCICPDSAQGQEWRVWVRGHGR